MCSQLNRGSGLSTDPGSNPNPGPNPNPNRSQMGISTHAHRRTGRCHTAVAHTNGSPRFPIRAACVCGLSCNSTEDTGKVVYGLPFHLS